MEKTIRQYARQKAIFCVYQNLLIDASLEDVLHFIDLDPELKDGYSAKKKAFVNEARVFAEELAKIDFIPVDKKNILIRFAGIGKKTKLRRMSFYKKNNFTRANHNIWFRLWV